MLPNPSSFAYGRMSRYVIQRLLGMLAVMFVVVTIVFIIVRIAPGDPAAVMLGPDATAQDIAALRTRLGLDQPLIVQYGIFFGQLLQGDLGESIFLNRPVLSALADRAEPTFFLTLFSIVIASADRHSGRHPVGLPARLDLRSGRHDAGDAGGIHSELLARPAPDPVLRRAARPVPGLGLRRSGRKPL